MKCLLQLRKAVKKVQKCFLSVESVFFFNLRPFEGLIVASISVSKIEIYEIFENLKCLCQLFMYNII